MATLIDKRTGKPFYSCIEQRSEPVTIEYLEVTGKKILWFFVKVLLTAVVLAAFLIGWLSL